MMKLTQYLIRNKNFIHNTIEIKKFINNKVLKNENLH